MAKKKGIAEKTAESLSELLGVSRRAPSAARGALGIPKVKDEGVKKLKLLVTVVDRSKAHFYTDVLEAFEINLQAVLYGQGTADSKMLGLLGLSESDKAVILSVVREDNVRAVLATLEEKFERVKNGRGIAFTVPFGSVIGVLAYRFLSNNKQGGRTLARADEPAKRSKKA